MRRVTDLDQANSEAMWSKLLSTKVTAMVMAKTEDDLLTVSHFFSHLKSKTDYKTIVILSTRWSGMEEAYQVNMAIKTVGMVQASRFLALLDTIAELIKEGEWS